LRLVARFDNTRSAQRDASSLAAFASTVQVQVDFSANVRPRRRQEIRVSSVVLDLMAVSADRGKGLQNSKPIAPAELNVQ